MGVVCLRAPQCGQLGAGQLLGCEPWTSRGPPCKEVNRRVAQVEIDAWIETEALQECDPRGLVPSSVFLRHERPYLVLSVGF